MNALLCVAGAALMTLMYVAEVTGQSAKAQPPKHNGPQSPSGRRLGQLPVAGQASDVQQCMEAMVKGLRPNERAACRFDSTPVRRGNVSTSSEMHVDCGFKGSLPLTLLQSLACGPTPVTIFVHAGKAEFESQVAVVGKSGLELVPFEVKFGVKNYLGDGIVGQYLPPAPPKGQLKEATVYSVSGKPEVHVLRDGGIVVTAYHEIFHAARCILKLPCSHGEPGVDKAIESLEREVSENAKK
jgi:hypothetical protein